MKCPLLQPVLWSLLLGLCPALAAAGDRAPVGVPDGVQKPLRLSPQPGNARNSEGDFIRLKDGRIMLIYSRFEGTSDHAAADLMARFSSDGGQTWSQQDQPVLTRSQDESNLMSVSLLRLQDQRIALFYVVKYHSPAGAGYPYYDRMMVRTSDDEAKTWSAPVEISRHDGPGYRVLNNDRVIQLANGRLVVPVATHYLPGQEGWNNSAVIHCYLSDDGGATWRSSQTRLSSEQLAQEPGVVALSDGRLLLFARSRQYQLLSHSGDGGETWTPLEPATRLTQPTTSPASIERLPATGDLLAVWNDGESPLAGQKPIGRRPFNVALSSDDGRTWHHARHIGTDPEGWYCYTAIEVVGDHLLLAHCEYPMLNSLQITRIPLTWLYSSP